MFDKFLSLVPPSLMHRSGAVFYAGREAFSAPSRVYLLGLNPGGHPERKPGTIEDNIKRSRPTAWSAYADESWRDRKPGQTGMQPRVLHLLSVLGLKPQSVPASNVVFVRSPRERDLHVEKEELLNACWPVHAAVIDELGIRVVVCFGRTAGAWVREKMGADQQTAEFIEANERRWRSHVHQNAEGQRVVTLTHPSIADWTASASDPTELVARALADAEKAAPPSR